MAGKSRRSKLVLSDEDRAELEQLSRSRTLPHREAQRAAILTPKHGSWLNIVETLFGKMARSFLRHIRVQSLDELKARILKGIEEINAAPVVHRWKNFEALAED